MSSIPAFADDDDDDKNTKFKKGKVFTGAGPPTKGLGKVGDLYINSSDIENLILWKKTAKNTWTNLGSFQGPPGQQGPSGEDGTPGQNGQNGISCWDTNANAHNDPSEDVNGDSLYNGLDCKGPQGEPGQNADVTDLQNQINSLIVQLEQLNSQLQSVQKTLCNDNNVYTSDMINPATNQCVNTTITCDDGNTATSDTFNPISEQCVNLECDDNDPSTFDKINTSTFQCDNLPIPVCDDGNPYTIDTYIGSDNTCSFTPLPDGTECDDGNPFTAPDLLSFGVCVGYSIDADSDGWYLPADCNDSYSSINPGSIEVFNGLDDNCNGSVDEGVVDVDGDGYVSDVDCDDNNASVNPAMIEVFNGLDDNCNGSVDEGVVDVDVDGYTSGVDCDDNNASVNPGAPEIVDGIDNNCNGLVDESSIIYFEEDFSDNSAGWTIGTTWQIGPATPSITSFLNPDPAQDNTLTVDNGVAGVIIGGNAPQTLHPYYYLQSPVINTASATGPVILEYSRWLNSDYTPYMQNQVQVFNGATWITVWESGGSPSIADNSWIQQTFDVTAFKNANMQVRFGYTIGSSGVFSVSSWNLDDIKVSTPIP
jgi:hypothetical protein